jgi:hypothetical protein
VVHFGITSAEEWRQLRRAQCRAAGDRQGASPADDGRHRAAHRRDRLEGFFDETFTRMWEFYLAYGEAGFRIGYLGVSQLGRARAPF